MSDAGAPNKEELQEKVSQYDNAIVADWVPQQALLDHPVRAPCPSPLPTSCPLSWLTGHDLQATGWYISHGGHNSTLETIMTSIPT